MGNSDMGLATSKQLMCAIFRGEEGADEALEELQASVEEEEVLIDSLTLLCMDEEEVISITESQGENPYWCGVLAAVVGLVSGPISAMQESGEGLLAWLDDEVGLARESMEEIVSSLESGGSVMLGIMDSDVGELVEEALEDVSEEIIWYEVGSELDHAD
ncbi:MAG: hypothetical protein MUP90_13875 [Gammaproteobacteria bacterium]|nr:hypothetical protein [Gammaproteobacteria bacterium]